MTESAGGSGPEEQLSTTISGPKNAAPDSPQRNRPQWDDLPIADDTANLRLGPDLHDPGPNRGQTQV